MVIQSLYDDFEKYNLDSNIVRKIVKVEKTQIAKKEPSQTQEIVKENKEVSDEKKLNLTYKAYILETTPTRFNFFASSVAILFLDKGKCKSGSRVLSIFKRCR